MPFIEGESLRATLEREKQLSIPESVRIVTQIAQALDYAHRHGVIHRDIKPENILLHDGSALVADFGIALAATSAGTRMTETGMSLGTPSYMSPEQAMGERALDARTDVYALGCVLYELLVGAPPFVGPTAQAIVTKVMTERPAPPSRARDTVNEALDDAVLRALSKVPADRFATAAEFSAALAAAMQGGNTTSVRRNAVAPPKSGGRTFVSGLIAGALGVAGIWLAAQLTTTRSAGTTEQRVQLSFDGLSEQPTISHDGKFVAYVRRPCPMSDVRECASSLLLREEGNDRTITLVDSAQAIGNVRWSADGSRLIFAAILDSTRGGIYSVPRLGGSLKLVTTRAANFDVHSREDSISVLQNGVVHVASLNAEGEADSVVLGRTALESTLGNAAIAWSPNGRFFAVTNGFSAIRLFSRQGALLDSVRSTFRDKAVWDADGRSLFAFVAREGKEDDLTRYPVGRDGKFEGAPQVVMSKVPAVLAGDFSIARETGRIALIMGAAISDLWTFELSTRESARRLTSGTAWYSRADITADGSQVWYMRGDGIGDNLYSVSMDGREEAQSAERGPAFVVVPRLSSDGRRVMYGHVLPTGSRVSEMQLPSREVRHADGWPELGALPTPVGARGVVYLSPTGDALYVADSMSATPRRIAFASGTRIYSVASGPSASEVMAIGRTATDGATTIGSLRIADGTFTPRARPEGQVTSISWRADGSMWFRSRGLGQKESWLWEVRAGSATPERRVRMPDVCYSDITSISAVAPRGVCGAFDRRADAWTVDLPGMMR